MEGSIFLLNFAGTMETVVLKELSIGYATKGNSKVVAQGLNAAIKSGELTCLLGCNGIGKSTLLRTLSAFQPALGGDIMLYNPLGSQLSALTSFSDKEAINMVGIESLRGRMIHTLSDGERQKVMIAKALAQQTPVIYLDEPTAFLDYPSKVEMMQLLCRLAHEQQKTIFLSTHDVELALQLADCLWLMEPGLLSVGTPRQLADNGALSRFIERDGIIFEHDTLTLRVSKQHFSKH